MSNSLSVLSTSRLSRRLGRESVRPSASGGRRTAGAAEAVVVWAVGMLTLYREVLTSRFATLQGNIGDQRLNLYLSEHWFRVAKGHAAWRDPGFFFPETGVLGFTDTLFLYQPIYIPLRLMGFDPFLSYQLTLMALTTIGFSSAAWFLRKVVGVRFPVALLGAFLFAFANALGVKTGHSQLYTINLVPLLGLLVALCLRSLPARPIRAAVTSAGAGLLLALLLFSSFYIGWFVLLVGAVVLVCSMVAAGRVLVPWIRSLVSRGRTTAMALGAVVAGFLVGLVPFLLTYLPSLESSGGRTYGEVLSLSPVPSDVVNVGGENLVWGDLLGAGAAGAEHLRDGERSLAVTPILVLSTLAGAIFRPVRVPSGPLRARARLVTGLVAAGLILIILPLKVGGVSAWRGVWMLVPGARAIRATARLHLMTNVVFVVALVLVLDAVVARLRTLTTRAAVVGFAVTGLVVALIAAEQVQVSHDASLSRDGERAALAAVPPPPSDCKAFFVSKPPAGRPFFASQIDAMLISITHHLPTINGYSGVIPDGWTLLDPVQPGYKNEVDTWLAANGLQTGVCEYELSTRAWRVPSSD